jgi:UDPglucose 6-dehydrogenase
VRVAVIGAGHVGLVTGVALASLGHDVAGMDVDADRVEALRKGEPPFYELELEEMLGQGLDAGRLRFTTSVGDAVADARVVFICVGRPPAGQGDRSLTAVEDAARDVAKSATDGVVLVVKSTVPPGTTGRVAKVVTMERPDLGSVAVSSPEFLREGRAIRDTLEPDRLVVGSDDERGFAVMRELYASMLEAGVRLIETDPRTAELSKLASNSFLALKVSFVNALARVGDLSGADVSAVAEIMGTDPRIGPAFLAAGLGYGGYCLPKDIVTLERLSDRLGYDFGILREAIRVNDEAIEATVRKVEEAVWNIEGKRVALLGLAFKPGTDDVRGAPALALAERLIRDGAHVVAFDPMAGAAASRALPDLVLAEDPYATAASAHCIVIATEWPEFGRLDLDRLRGVMAIPAVVDGRNLLDGATVAAAGFHYYSVGRPSLEPTPGLPTG